MENDILAQKIIGAAIEVHRTPGPRLLESIYEEALCDEFDLRGIGYRRQVEIDVIYKNKVIKGQRLDILVEEVIVEIKSLNKVAEVSMAQVLSYPKATGLKRAPIINFGAKMLREG